MKKLLIAVDIEGVAGVWRPEQTRAGNPEYERARSWMTAEASAAVRGAFAAGFDAVLVNDSHGSFCNLLADQLDPRAMLIQGKPRMLGMMAGVDQGVDAVCLIGWHCRSKAFGTLAHTGNSFAFSRVWLNQIEVGELGLYARLAGHFGVPVLAASGDAQLAEELAMVLPDAAAIVVKWAESAHSGRSLSPQHSQALIEEGVTKALLERHQAPLQMPGPLSVRLQCQTPAQADWFALLPGTQRLAADELSFEAAGIAEVVRTLNCFSAMSSVLR